MVSGIGDARRNTASEGTGAVERVKSIKRVQYQISCFFFKSSFEIFFFCGMNKMQLHQPKYSVHHARVFLCIQLNNMLRISFAAKAGI